MAVLSVRLENRLHRSVSILVAIDAPISRAASWRASSGSVLMRSSVKMICAIATAGVMVILDVLFQVVAAAKSTPSAFVWAVTAG